MDQRKRLIELLRSAPRTDTVYGGIKLTEPVQTLQTIADHLLANGVIVPPVKVGDTVYVISQGAGFSVVWNVYKATAKAIHLDQYGQLFIHVETDKENIGGYVEIERVFLTEDEAEKALAKRKGGE